jgi:hypothetical protein
MVVIERGKVNISLVPQAKIRPVFTIPILILVHCCITNPEIYPVFLCPHSLIITGHCRGTGG